MAKKIAKPLFSNGTEFMMWESENCDRCIKAPKPHEDGKSYSKSRCAIYNEITRQCMGYGNEPVSQRAINATTGRCPYIRTEWPKRKRKSNDQSLTLDFK